MSLGIYISVPFCRSKCSYCNFASGVFSRARYQAFVDRVCRDIADAEAIAADQQAQLGDRSVDSVYLGGGTPTVLESAQLEQLFKALRAQFNVLLGCEITVECAPGTLSDAVLQTLLGCGVNRVSLGVQSFVDEEARAVGRVHTREIVLADIARLRAAAIQNLNIDLIAGLPHQTAASWERSLDDAIASGAAHVSIYMLEVDEDSRLGSEVIAGGKRYHAHAVPDEDLTADLYLRACERLNAAGIEQYEISNFARSGWRSRHNLKYWTRQPYFGFGLDAHSMLLPNAELQAGGVNAIRFFMPSELDEFLSDDDQKRRPGNEIISELGALEEAFFLGLRLNSGVDLAAIEARFAKDDIAFISDKVANVCNLGLAKHEAGRLFLTERGRLLSNEVFEKFVALDISEDELMEMLDLDRMGELPVPNPPTKH
jgi:oxygen-independent coproporphyrinogen-3 oxidase